MSAPKGHRVELTLAGTTCSFETGRLARQATSAVVTRSGDNVILATVVEGKPRGDGSFFPLTVEYREKYAAAGRIPGGYTRREGRITDHEVLVSRLIDRTVRSLFPETYLNEVQIQAQVLSAEPTADLASLALLGVCAALHLAPVPFRGPAAGLRIARHRGTFLPFPAARQRADADIDFVVAFGPEGLVMVEGEAAEQSEADCLAALAQAAEWAERFRRLFDELRGMVGTQAPATLPDTPLPDPGAHVGAALMAALGNRTKAARRAAVAAVRDAFLAAAEPATADTSAKAFAELEWRTVREQVLSGGKRLDGRGPSDIRTIWGEVGLLPRAHGSAVFTRGETQALCTCTLGTGDDALRVDGLAVVEPERFILHYNFPPYSVNETKPLRGPGRREIGHGTLARRGLVRLLPSFETWPYTLRLESEITESNGSSSMATVCGGTLALMDAGVPITRPVAGIAMGMISDGERVAILSDILGDEDHLGDMDFKVVGTERGITALQLDNKIGGLAPATLAQAFEQARVGRLQILGAMAKVLARPRDEPSRYAPRVAQTAIMPSSIGALVGPKGQNIRAVQAATNTRVAIDDSGQVLVYASDAHSAQRAMQMIKRTAGILRVGNCYNGVVTGVKDFGAFVRVNDVNEGLVPSEELVQQAGQRVGDVVQEGDAVVVKVLGADSRGRLRLSCRQAAGALDLEF